MTYNLKCLLLLKWKLCYVIQDWLSFNSNIKAICDVQTKCLKLCEIIKYSTVKH